ncbi:ABC-type phosphate/phosphonate transport system permease subunit [Mycoplasma testudineum]|uniref:ABC-type phosphate/phosphonate transport system permease subunit n=1 Tax=Mycoplasma testudineum TaxID=244584 RepID=A0A4R6ICV6_9MOLU|nr:hypothetical protein [Mycoplasma testudineum]OYD26585.1 hypothetical protein CG473_03025 [Mycoplasma testudineum]TDO19417.1 ABC-type phosphate/phosphonate transport system permease subunit [Mycoplasma testudineum]
MKSKLNAREKFNRKRLIFLIIILIFIALVIVSFFVNKSYTNTQGWINFFNNVSHMFSFRNNSPVNENLLFETISLFFINIFFVSSGTLIGAFFAYFFIFFSSDRIQSNRIKIPFKFFIYISYCLPFFIFAFLFIGHLNIYLGTIFTVAWISFILIHRSLNSFIEKADLGYYYQMVISGRSKFYSYSKWLHVHIDDFYRIILLRLESNSRYTSFIPFFGAPHAASLLGNFVSHGDSSDFNYLGIPLLTLIILYIIFEILIFKAVSFFKYEEEKNHNFHNIRKAMRTSNIFNFFFLTFWTLIALAALIVGFYSTTQNEWINYGSSVRIVFESNFSNFSATYFFTSSGITFLQIVFAFALAIFAGFLCGILLSPVTTPNVVNKIAFLLVFLFRTMPTIVLFFLFRPIFDNAITTAIFSVAISQSISLAMTIKSRIGEWSRDINKKISLSIRKIGWFRTQTKFTIPLLSLIGKESSGMMVYDMLQHLLIFGAFSANPIGINFSLANSEISTVYVPILKSTIPNLIPFIFLAVLSVNYQNFVLEHFASFRVKSDFRFAANVAASRARLF